MNRFLAGLVLAQFALPVVAQELQSQMMKGCEGFGNDPAECACVYDLWSAQVPEGSEMTAAAALAFIYGGPVPALADMEAVGSFVAALSDAAITCASGKFAAEDDLAPIPETGDAAEEAALLARLSAGKAKLGEMMRYDALVEARKAAEREAEAAANAARAERALAARAELSEAYDAALTRLHSRPLAEWGVNDYRPSFLLHCEMNGGTAGECACGWGKLTDLANSHVLIYLASRSEGDDVLEYLSSGELYGTLPALRLFNERRATCEGL